MKYCSKCKKLIFSDDIKCSCGKKLTENPNDDVPVVLIVAESVDKERIKASLDDSDIPYSMQIQNDRTNVTSVPGIETAAYRFLVPLGFYKKAVDVLVGISAMELPEHYDDILTTDEPEWEEMSPTKRNVVRILSALGFIILVWLCVAGVDLIAELITSLFK